MVNLSESLKATRETKLDLKKEEEEEEEAKEEE